MVTQSEGISAEQTMQRAFNAYVEGVDSVDKMMEFKRVEEFVIRGVEYNFATDCFRYAIRQSRNARNEDPNIDFLEAKDQKPLQQFDTAR